MLLRPERLATLRPKQQGETEIAAPQREELSPKYTIWGSGAGIVRVDKGFERLDVFFETLVSRYPHTVLTLGIFFPLLPPSTGAVVALSNVEIWQKIAY